MNKESLTREMQYDAIADEVATFQRSIERAFLKRGVTWTQTITDLVRTFMMNLLNSMEIVNDIQTSLGPIHTKEETKQTNAA